MQYTINKIMGASKTENYTELQNHISLISKALGHPARVAIVDYLIKVDTCICGDIVNELPLSQPTVSQHLRELKNAGIIQGTIEGNAICYCLNQSTLESFINYLSEVSQTLKTKSNTCC